MGFNVKVVFKVFALILIFFGAALETTVGAVSAEQRDFANPGQLLYLSIFPRVRLHIIFCLFWRCS